MKRFIKASTSLLVVLMLFAMMCFTNASAATGTVVSNTGVRHTVCTSLSIQAKKYYSTNKADFDNFSKLKGGSSNCLTTVNSALFDKLHDLMEKTMTDTVTYKSLTTYWEKTDANNASNNACIFYSDEISSSYNREHVWPKSHASFHEKNGGADPHHLRPTDSAVNSTRSNSCFTNVRKKFSSYSTKNYNGKTVLYYKGQEYVEVNDNIKGDVARILLYVYCRWEEPNLFMDTSNPVLGPSDEKNDGEKVIESLDILLEWCEIDPVDSWEMGRNDQCENLVGNRNVFIDYPEYAWLLFGKSVPTNMTTPSGEAKGGINPGTETGGNASSNQSSSNPSSSSSTGNVTSDRNDIDTSNNNANSNHTSSDNATSGVGAIENKPQNEGKPFDPSNLGGTTTLAEEDESSFEVWMIIVPVAVVSAAVIAVAVIIIIRKKKIK